MFEITPSIDLQQMKIKLWIHASEYNRIKNEKFGENSNASKEDIEFEICEHLYIAINLDRPLFGNE